MTGETPLYRALEGLSIRTPNGGRREVAVGSELSFEGKPGPALLPLNASARANKLRAIVAGPGPHRPVEPTRLARSLGFTGRDPNEALNFIRKFVDETARENAS